jgi:16S rRNA (uracil1498-N3)-methyltransferase
MDCLFAPDLTADSRIVPLTPESERHARALRLRDGESVLLTNGTGLCARAGFVQRGTSAHWHIHDILPQYGELGISLTIALGLMEQRDRMEFAIEKCTELGMTHFVPLITRYTQRKTVQSERLQSKALSAMIQCKRSCLPLIAEPMKLTEFLASLAPDTMVIVGSADGKAPLQSLLDRQSEQLIQQQKLPNEIVCIIGAEGGLHHEEMAHIDAQVERGITIHHWNIGSRRLRAETAAVSMIALCVALFEHRRNDFV